MADDQLDEVVGRVESYITHVSDGGAFRVDAWLVDDAYPAMTIGDLRALLAAFQSVREERDKLIEGVAEVLEIINNSDGPRGINATENDLWSEFYAEGLLAKFDAACDIGQAIERRTGGTE